MAQDFREALFDEMQRVVCLILSTGEASTRFFNDEIVDPLQEPFRLPRMPNIPGWWHRFFCDREPPPPSEPWFPGGQCSVNYTLTGTIESELRSPSTGDLIQVFTDSGTVTVPGPISEFRFESAIIDGGANRTNVLYARNATTGAFYDIVRRTGAANALQVGRLLSKSIVRTDGLLDNCGSTPIPDPPSGWNIRPFVVVYQPGDGPSIEINGDLKLSFPRININGQLVAPITLNFNLPDISIGERLDFELNLTTGDFTYDVGPEIGFTFNINNPGFGDPYYPPPGENPGEGPPSGNPEGDEVDPDSPGGKPGDGQRKMVGALVFVSGVDGVKTRVFDTNSPDLLLPDAGKLVYKVVVGGSVAYTEPVRIQFARQYIPVPGGLGAVDVSVIDRSGVDVEVVPIYDHRTVPKPVPS